MKLFFGKKDKKKNSKKNKIEDFSGETPSDIFEEEKIYQEGLIRVLDFISPSAMEISTSHIQIGVVYCRTLFVAAYPRVLSIGWLGSVIDMDIPTDISIFIHPVDTGKVLKGLRKKSTQMQSQLNIEATKGLTRDPKLEMAHENVEELRNKLQEGTEKFFKVGLYINVFGKDLKDLEKKSELLESILNAKLVFIKKAVFRMKEGLDSCLPLCTDKLLSGINLNTAPVSTTFPFISADVTSNQGVLYGINRHNSSLILFDRFSMENANMVVFAKSGAGKSYTVKLEALRSMMLGTTVIIIDPEDEYRYLAEATGGSFVKISLTSPSHLNPFDLPKMGDDESVEDVLRSNIANLEGLFKLMLGNITPEEESIMERAIKETYAIRDITEKTQKEKINTLSPPLLSDFYEVLRNMKGAEDLTIRLEKYTEGIFSGFLNKASNVSLNNQLVVFNIRDLEEELRPIAMYVVLHYIWNEIRTTLKKRLVIVDEAWVMMQHEDAAKFMFAIAKRIRKYYGGLTTITQDISDFMSSRYGKPIVSNSSIQILMRQSQSSIDVITDTFYLTEREKYLLLESKVGEGIFFAGTKRAAIQVVASYNEDKIVTTNPAQKLEMERQKKEEAEKY
jgi:conjugal transfer ATP-binding protein TraC